MGPASNWLSFSLSPMEMLRSSSSEPQLVSFGGSVVAASAPPPPHYLIDKFYANGWTNPKHQLLCTEGENQRKGTHPLAMPDEYSIITSFHQQPPKLEDFLGGDSPSIVRYSDSQTETQDSSLTQIYDHSGGSGYFNEQHQDLKRITGFQTVSNNSASEVVDSASMGRTQLIGVESSGTELGFSNSAALSLGVNQSCERDNNNSTNINKGDTDSKAIASVDSDSSKKIADTFGQRTSIFRGVTRHRWTGRYEAHLWDNSCRREGQARKGRQVYLGGYDKEEKAARAYDLAALKYWGPTATTNLPISNYTKELEEMKHVTKQEFIASLRRKSSGFSRGASIYRGVTRHHQQGRWQARIGRVAGNKDLYLGTFATEEEAAEAYDIAAIKFRGVNAVTNFEMSRYDVEAIAKTLLPIGGAAKRLKLSLENEQKPVINPLELQPKGRSNNSNISFAPEQLQPVSSIPCGIPFDTAALYQHNLYHHIQSANISVSDPPPAPSISSGPNPVTSQPAEFFLWPHHSY